jgi:outer membrane protein assembly factor BamE (lipoprotein component of BamABCDE complex)
VSGSIPLCCCLGPPHVIRLEYGNYPIGRFPNDIRPGMSAEEVVATLGTPHERHSRGDVDSWFYWIDSFGLGWFGVDFGPDGRVTHTYGN